MYNVDICVDTVDKCTSHSNISRCDMRNDTLDSSSKPLSSFSDVLYHALLSSYCHDQFMRDDNVKFVCTQVVNNPPLRLWNDTHMHVSCDNNSFIADTRLATHEYVRFIVVDDKPE